MKRRTMHVVRGFGWISIVCLLTTIDLWSQESPRCDVLLRQGTIHSGDGSPPMLGDVAVLDGRILAIGPNLSYSSNHSLNCDGFIVCPGMIDLHTHSDGPVLQRNTRSAINYLMQGCTTSVTGNCGSGPVDVGKYLDQVDREGAGTHIVHLLPHGSLRDQVVGKEDRPPTESELKSMRELAEKAMQDGAFGMSTGLIYIPGTFSKTEELIDIAKIVGKHQGVYASHIRNEGKNLIDSVQEAIRIGQEGQLPVHISHLKASGTPSWGTLHLAVNVIEKARSEGMAITADQYPYTASSTSLEATLIPSWAREGGRDALEKRLQDPTKVQDIRDAIEKSLAATHRILLATCKYRPAWIGRSLDEIATTEKLPIAEVVIAIEKAGGASVVNFGMSEEDVRMAMQLPWVATASDGGVKVPTSSQPHPRSYGTFPRKIGRYAIEEGVMSLAQAIRSATGLPASILGLKDRGRLSVGLIADIAVFDPSTYRDQATYERPYLYPSGIKHVLVAGSLSVYEGQPTGILAGKSIRKTSSKE